MPDRIFTSFSQAAEEGGISRIYAGIHYPFDSADGLALGQQVGDYVVGHEFVPEPGAILVCVAGTAGLAIRRRQPGRNSAHINRI